MTYEEDLSAKHALVSGLHDSIHTVVKYGGIILVVGAVAMAILSEEQKGTIMERIISR